MSLILLTWIEFSIKDPISRECSLHRSTNDGYIDTVNIIYIQNLSRIRHITLFVALFTKQRNCLFVFISDNYTVFLSFSILIFCLKIFNLYI